jgi:protein-S-isoprenylcysteine O-methyltransferase Ste14
MRAIFALYAAVAYLVFLASFLYAVAFVGNIGLVPKTIDSGTPDSLSLALVANLLVLGAFAVQHSVMARPAFKRWWTRIVPVPMERSTYVLVSSLLLLLLFVVWRPLPEPVWTVQAPLGKVLLTAMFWVGWLTVLCSTFMINHFELFGLKQAIAKRMESGAPVSLTTRYLYRFVRHPIMLGFIIAFWSAPAMSQGHLLFAVMTTAYIFIGIALEEHDMLAAFGEAYRTYRERVPMIFPFRLGKRAGTPPPARVAKQ